MRIVKALTHAQMLAVLTGFNTELLTQLSLNAVGRPNVKFVGISVNSFHVLHDVILVTKNSVKVYYSGIHTCQASLKTSGNLDKIKQIVKNNPTIKPTEVQSSILVSAFREQLDWQTVEKEARSVVNKRRISYIKEKNKNQVEPYGHNFEAIVNFKEYCDKKDKFYVYKVNDKRGNPDQPSFVFKTSMEKLKIAIAMDSTTDGFLREEFCFFDGKHKRYKSGFHHIDSKCLSPATSEANSSSYYGS